MKTITPERTEVTSGFANPPVEYGPVPFWWWVGEPLTRERLAWQLDQLRAKGVLNAIISYNHDSEGRTDVGDPPLFSEQWWDLFRWVVDYCKRHGMQIGFQDYTVINPALQAIGDSCPDMRGFGSLQRTGCRAAGNLSLKVEGVLVAAFAHQVVDGRLQVDTALDLTSQVRASLLQHKLPSGEWEVSLITVRPLAFDPTHPDSGARAIAALMAVFEEKCPGELGKTITILFQDELDFFYHSGVGFPIWSAGIEAQFHLRKGYRIRPWLAALWSDLGPMTAKVRIDFNDVCVQLLEEHYFRPIFEWCEARGVLWGNDNCGRGKISRGKSFYGDPFRTMRWYGAPGNDDPGPVRGRAFAGFKVNSSIAHLYGRARVWNEAFHSSGWGFSPAEIVAGFNEDSAAGATLFNLHGLYYTTFGGWWEWAPPDFHFRQPYWEHTDALSLYVRRVCWLLSQGVHVCDLAVLYPITTIEAEMNGAAAEEGAFGLGKHLFEAGMDFDFIDFESVERAEIADARLEVAGEAYRVLILPRMEAVRWATLEKIRRFADAGGLVIAFGCLPMASDRAGSFDPELDALVQEIWGTGNGIFIPEDYFAVQQCIKNRIGCDFTASKPQVYALHRRTNGLDVYFVFNKAENKQELEMRFRAEGPAQRWDAWTGERTALAEGPAVRLSLERGEAQIVVFGADDSIPHGAYPSMGSTETLMELDGDWEFELVPTLDNRFGDFRLPATPEKIGVEVRRFRHCDEREAPAGWFAPTFDDAHWPEVACSFGPRFWRLGPLPPGTDLEALEAKLASMDDAPSAEWKPYSFSLRWGVENDPFMKDTRSGPHGLKQKVPDDFIDLGTEPPGSVFYLWASVDSQETREARMVVGSRSAFDVWINQEPVVSQSQALPPGRRTIWNLPHYDSEPIERIVCLKMGHNPFLLKLTSSEGQRLRAHVAFDPPAETRKPLTLRAFSEQNGITYNYRPQDTEHAGCYRFEAPPGLQSLVVHTSGPIRIWVNGNAISPTESKDCRHHFHLENPCPHRSIVAVRVSQRPDSYEGDSLPEPIVLTCGKGLAATGDWRGIGLAGYSGGVVYRRKFNLSSLQAKDPCLVLDLGNVAATAEVRLNGQSLAKIIAPPWQVNLGGKCRHGENLLEIVVMNTLANHYLSGTPSPYAWEAQTVSGLLGPVQINRKTASLKETVG